MQPVYSVNFKKTHPDAKAPLTSQGNAGADLTAVSKNLVTSDDGYYYVEYDTGIAVEIPAGHMGLIFPRSSISKTVMILANCVGVVDESYRGSIKLRFKVDSGFVNDFQHDQGRQVATYNVGDRIGQLIIVPYPRIVYNQVEELSNTSRGEGGFGSTGK